MQPIYRRDFLRTLATAAAAAGFTINLQAEQPNTNPLLARIDTNRLGPNGEITAGFLLTLNPRPCSHFNHAMYESKSTDPAILSKIFRDLSLHGNKPDHIKEACREGQRRWKDAQANTTEHNPSP